MTNWEHAAGIVWPLLTTAASRAKTLTYGDIAPKIPTNPLSVGLALGPIQTHCLENRLPPLTAIVVRKGSGLPGQGFIAWDVDDLPTAHKRVFEFKWSTAPNPYGNFGATDSIETLGNALAKHPSEGLTILRTVRDRGIFQKIFRVALLQLYSRCAMCDCSFHDALEAAHIVPWSKCNDAARSDVRNGLLLCAIHHRLFDRGLITVSTQYKISSSNAHPKVRTEIDQRLSIDLDGKQLRLPLENEKRPSVEYLSNRLRMLDADRTLTD